jgi:hypothetical protein
LIFLASCDTGKKRPPVEKDLNSQGTVPVFCETRSRARAAAEFLLASPQQWISHLVSQAILFL